MASDFPSALSEQDIDLLLEVLCIDLGFCFHGEIADRFYESTPATTEAFIEAVFLAEGSTLPAASNPLYVQVRHVIERAFAAQPAVQRDGPASGGSAR